MGNLPNITDWIASLGGLAGFSALGIELWRNRGRRKRPPEGRLVQLQWLDEALGDIIAYGGQESFWFLDAHRRHNETLLAVLAGQIADDDLNELVSDARANYNDAGSHAPGHDQLPSPASAKQVELQIQAATRARASCSKAIDRCNELMRKHPQ